MKRVRIEFSGELLLFMVFILLNCIYPVWYVPTKLIAKLLLLNILFLASGAFLFLKIFSTIGFSGDLTHINFKKCPIVMIPILISVILHSIFWKIPVEVGNDIESLISPPAYFLAKIYAFFSVEWLHWLAIGGIILIALIFLKTQSFNLNLLLSKKIKLVLYLTTFVVLNIYGVMLYKLQIIEHVGKIETIIRFPPLSKFLYIAGFLIFGIQESVPRMIQFLFLISTAIYMTKLMKIWYQKIPKMAVFFIVLLFPPFFHFSNTPNLTCGVIFFFTAITYHFFKTLLRESELHYFLFAFFLIAGLLYRRLIVGIFPAILVTLLFLYVKGKINTKKFIKYLKIKILATISAIPLYSAGIVTGVRNTAFSLTKILDFNGMISGIVGFMKTNNIILSSIIICTLIYSLLKCKRKMTGYWLILFVSYYLWISLSGVAMFSIRYFQPVYLVLIIGFINFITDLYNERFPMSKKISIAIIVIFVSASLYENLFSKSPFQRKNLTNIYMQIYPYDKLMIFLKNKLPMELKIYAPMECEPSHFYLAKYRLVDKVHWEREMPPLEKLTAEYITQYMENKKLDFLFLPDVREFENIIKEISRSGNFYLYKEFAYGNNKGFLFARKKELQRGIENIQ
jgi:hypothetical protein